MLQTKEITENEAELSAAELGRLAQTAGAEPCVTVIQRKETFDPATYIGKGKAEEIASLCEAQDISLAVVDDEISGSQAKNLEEVLGVRVIDRTTLILDIFAQRARSSEGRLQVELAQMKYMLPRLTGQGESLSRLGGGIGTRGPGESKLETDRRHIRRRIKTLENSLADIEKRRMQSRSRRDKNELPSVALVGYTNAGKSSLMNALCLSDEVYVEDKLFATLDSTTRKMCFPDNPNRTVLLTDTVGFIRKLPHTLIDAFKSTLDEAVSADILLHVVDASDPEAETHIETVESILSNLGASKKPTFLVFNKTDKLIVQSDEYLIALGAKHKQRGADIFEVSVLTGEGIDNLRNKIKETFR